MRKVEREVIGAFLERRSRKVGNTRTDGDTLYLHGNAIAQHSGEFIKITLAGWPTVTTRSRLNVLCEMMGVRVRVSQCSHRQWLTHHARLSLPMEADRWYYLSRAEP
jgi:hypothetical protein